jgi:cyclohexanone monooxygenase
MSNSKSNHGEAGIRALDVIVVGAGFAGLYMLHALRRLGFSVQVYERGGDVGGTWYWNRYPGARCDVESLQYSYSFSEELQQEWTWSERYAPQPEILRYLNHVADRFDLRRDILLGADVVSAVFDETGNAWQVTTSEGHRASARFLVMATGVLSVARLPDIAGRDAFRGRVFHTGEWPHEPVDFSGQRVAVIGTGSSGLQCIPIIAQQAARLFVFQRTATFSVPAWNGRMESDYERSWKANYPERRRYAREDTRTGTIFDLPKTGALEISAEERNREYEARWEKGGINFLLSFTDIFTNRAANETAAEFVRSKIAQIVKDRDAAKLLQPQGYPIGTKRLCVDTDYHATFNRDNVTLVDIRSDPIVELTSDGIRTRQNHFALDAVVFATGYDAITGSFTRVDIRGREGLALRDKWARLASTYLGLMTAGFPNLFTVTGPGSPSVLSNVVVSIEQHVEWIAGCIGYMRTNAIDVVEASQQAEDRWTAQVDELAKTTLYAEVDSWYAGANIPGKPKRFMPYVGGVNSYRRICDRVAAQDYEGFVMTRRASVS